MLNSMVVINYSKGEFIIIHIIKAKPNHVAGISKVCSDGYWATYRETHTEMYIKGIIKEFYNPERILKEVSVTSREWGGYFVALEGNEIIGTMILDAITKQQKEEFNATEQWVSVARGNQKGIPFYEAKGFILNHERDGHGIVERKKYTSLRYCRPI